MSSTVLIPEDSVLNKIGKVLIFIEFTCCWKEAKSKQVTTSPTSFSGNGKYYENVTSGRGFLKSYG